MSTGTPAPDSPAPRILAAAVRINGATVSMPPPARHWHIVQSLMGATQVEIAAHIVGPDDQGFLDERGEFVSRELAMAIARQSGQLRRPSTFRELFSEDLW